MRVTGLVVAALLCAVVVACGSEDGDAIGDDDPATMSPTASEHAAHGDLMLDCEQRSSSTTDLIPPESVEAAREAGWPSTPEEAARSVVSAPAYADRLKGVELSQGTPVEFGGAPSAIRYLAVAADGRVQGAITVDEILPDVWASAHVSICSSASE